MTCRRATAIGRAAAVMAVLVGAALLLTGTDASAGGDPEALLEKARTASATGNIEGTVEIRWVDGDEILVERVGARSRGDAYVVGRGDNVAVGRDGVGYAADDGVATRWGRGPMRAAPSPSATWQLELDDAATVAGRTTKVVAARDDAGNLRARFFVDAKTNMLLRRDVFDRDGTLQLFYGDGLFSLSVFEQDGLVDWGSVPEGGRPTTVEGERARTYSTAAGTVAVWGEGGLVFTCVSDAPADTVQAVLPGVVTDDESGFDEIVDFVFGPFGWK